MNFCLAASALFVTVVGILSIVFRTRIALYRAVSKERKRSGELPVYEVSLAPGETTTVLKFIDDLDGWAGHFTITRNGDVYTASCFRGRYHSGPSNDQALYINGKKLKANRSVEIPAAAQVVLRDEYAIPKVISLALTTKEAEPQGARANVA